MSFPAPGTNKGLALMPYHSALQGMGLRVQSWADGEFNNWDYYYRGERLIHWGYSKVDGTGVRAYIYTKESPINKCSRKIDIESSNFSEELREMLRTARLKSNGQPYRGFALNIGIVYNLDATLDKRHFKAMIQHLIEQVDVVVWSNTLLERVLEQKNTIQF